MEKKLNPQVSTILLAFFGLVVTSLACQSKSEKSPSEEGNSFPFKTRKEVIQAPSKKKDGFHLIVKGDSIIHQIHLNNTLHYESLFIKDKRIYNYIYPHINDFFLFEDKYYLKISYPVAFSGAIDTNIPECPDYVLTPLDDGVLQVVIYNALDLKEVDFMFNYLPSEKDSLVQSQYYFNHVIFN